MPSLRWPKYQSSGAGGLKLVKLRMPTSTAATVTYASVSGLRFPIATGIVIGPRGRISSGRSTASASWRSPGATLAQVRPRARAGMRFAAMSIGR